MKTTRTVLQNDTLTVAIELHGAELKSIVSRETGDEYLWSADPAYWGRSAPILFPIVGMLRDNRYTVAGTTYSLPQHGFARDSVFQRISREDATATFMLQENEITWKQYPYRFRLEARYTLQNNRVDVGYRVFNPDEKKSMLFSIGSHPAFKIPFAGGTLEDYFIEFERKEDVNARLPEDGLQSDQSVDPFETSPVSERSIIRLHRNVFNRGAFIFKDIKSRTITLRSRHSSQQIRVDTGGAPYLGIWSKADGAPFVCIEPWFGVADSKGSGPDFSRKEGIIRLEPGHSWNGFYSIQIIASKE